MFHHDRSRLHRENVVLTREINDLRRKAKAFSLQQKGVERASHIQRCDRRFRFFVFLFFIFLSTISKRKAKACSLQQEGAERVGYIAVIVAFFSISLFVSVIVIYGQLLAFILQTTCE